MAVGISVAEVVKAPASATEVDIRSMEFFTGKPIIAVAKNQTSWIVEFKEEIPPRYGGGEGHKDYIKKRQIVDYSQISKPNQK